MILEMSFVKLVQIFLLGALSAVLLVRILLWRNY